jgi:hypothetical protein
MRVKRKSHQTLRRERRRKRCEEEEKNRVKEGNQSGNFFCRFFLRNSIIIHNLSQMFS